MKKGITILLTLMSFSISIDKALPQTDSKSNISLPLIEKTLLSVPKTVVDVQTSGLKVQPSDGEWEDYFGCSVSISGDYALVGAYGDDDKGDLSGSAYIFERNGSTWNQTVKLLASDGSSDDYFGSSVSISGDYAIVGARRDDDNGRQSGSAYIFKRNGSDWIQMDKLVANDGASWDYFGCSVSISDDYAIVGAYDKGNGTAYIFRLNGNDWTQTHKLLADDGSSSDWFGHSVAVSGDYAIVGADADDDKGGSSGSAYIFKRNGSDWIQMDKLVANDGMLGQHFGRSVSITGDYAIIGVDYDNDKGENSGSAYMFRRNENGWLQMDKLLAYDGSSYDYFGESVSISGDYAVVGAHNATDNDGNDAGAAYIFIRNGQDWRQIWELNADDDSIEDFGSSVSISNDFVLVGAPGDNDNGTNSGSAYIYFLDNQDPPDLSDGLVAHYPFDGDATDQSGNNNHGIINGSIESCEDRFGTPNSAFCFDNADYIDLILNNGSTTINSESSGKNTVAFWMYIDNDNVDFPFSWAKYGLEYWNDRFGFNTWQNDILGISSSDLQNQWIHFASVFSNGNVTESKLYINGELQQLSQLIDPPNNSNAVASVNARIGGPFDPSNHYYLTGKMDDVRIYNRELTEEEIQELYGEYYSYRLKRIIDGSLDYFAIDKHIWYFPDIENNMWPESWWGGDPPRFDYTPPTYPVLWSTSIFDARSYNFPDWPLFVEALGADYCYLSPPPGVIIYRPSAVEKWKIITERQRNSKNGKIRGWKGSCAGFAITSLYAFDNEEEFKSNYMLNFENLYDLKQPDDNVRKVINLFWTLQSKKGVVEHEENNWEKTPRQTLNECKEMFLNNERDDRYLILKNLKKPGGHTVVPYKIEKDEGNQNIEYILVYDSNWPEPSIIEPKIEINFQDDENGVWKYDGFFGTPWEGKKGMFLSLPISHYTEKLIHLKHLNKNTVDIKLLDLKFIEIYSSTSTNIKIENQHGESIGFKDSLIFNNFDEAIPIIPNTGGYSPPMGYFMPDAEYNIIMTDFVESVCSVSIFTDSLVYNYSRENTLFDQTDDIKYKNGISITNRDYETKTIKLEAIKMQESNEKVANISNFEIIQNDSIRIEIDQNNNIELYNYGSSKNYDLRMVYATTETELTFEHHNISISKNTLHTITSTWENLEDQPVSIIIDNDMDGVNEDTSNVDNNYTGIEKDRPSSKEPNNYYLLQNFPNPFNPETTIHYQIPKASHVSLVVFNSLGQQIRTLVDKEQLPGLHTIQWDGKDNLGHPVSSGLYFYTLRAGEFRETRKALLLR